MPEYRSCAACGPGYTCRQRICPTCHRQTAHDGTCYKHFPEKARPRDPGRLARSVEYTLQHCYACDGPLESDRRLPAEKVCRNPECRKYVAPENATYTTTEDARV